MKRITVRILLLIWFFSGSLYGQFSKAPDINLPELFKPGNQVSLTDFKGKVIYLDFWASWCKPCRKSFPVMLYWQQSFHDEDFQVVAINLDESKEQGIDFIRSLSMETEEGNQVDRLVKLLWDQTGITPKQYAIKGMPSSVLIDKKGNIRFLHTGFRAKDASKLKTLIQELIDES